MRDFDWFRCHLQFGSDDVVEESVRRSRLITALLPERQIIKDYKLFMVVGVLVAIDIVTLTAWQILDPFYRKTSLGVPVVGLLLM